MIMLNKPYKERLRKFTYILQIYLHSTQIYVHSTHVQCSQNHQNKTQESKQGEAKNSVLSYKKLL